MSKKKVAFYGSLRKGEYNYNAFVRHYGAENYVFQKTATVPGYELFSLGSYPGINPSSNPETAPLVVDIFELGEEAYESVRRMELGAGYKEVLLNIDGEDVIIYEYMYKCRPENLVKSGDWSEYLSEKKAESNY